MLFVLCTVHKFDISVLKLFNEQFASYKSLDALDTSFGRCSISPMCCSGFAEERLEVVDSVPLTFSLGCGCAGWVDEADCSEWNISPSRSYTRRLKYSFWWKFMCLISGRSPCRNASSKSMIGNASIQRVDV